MNGKAFVSALVAVILVAALTAIAFAASELPANGSREQRVAQEVQRGMIRTSTGGFVSAIGPSVLETARQLTESATADPAGARAEAL